MHSSHFHSKFSGYARLPSTIAPVIEHLIGQNDRMAKTNYPANRLPTTVCSEATCLPQNIPGQLLMSSKFCVASHRPIYPRTPEISVVTCQRKRSKLAIDVCCMMEDQNVSKAASFLSQVRFNFSLFGVKTWHRTTSSNLAYLLAITFQLNDIRPTLQYKAQQTPVR